VQIYQDLQKAGHEVWLPFVVRYVPIIPDGNRAGNKDGVAIDLFHGSGRELDREHLWNVEIFGKIIRILAAVFPDHDWEGFDTETRRRRGVYTKATKETLADPKKQARTWWKTYFGITSSILNSEQREELRNQITQADLEVRKIELEQWISKRIKLYTGLEDTEKECPVCKLTTDHYYGINAARIHTWRSWLCRNCGHETKEKVGESDAA
jgi:hypothetical protein